VKIQTIVVVLTNSPGGDFDPAWSPDGRRIAFYSARGGNKEIYVMDADGGNIRNLTNDPKTDGRPSWSPDGQSIAFNSDRDGDHEIYIMDADGSNQRSLTNNSAGDWGPDWFDPAIAVAPVGKLKGTWGWVKQSSE